MVMVCYILKNPIFIIFILKPFKTHVKWGKKKPGGFLGVKKSQGSVTGTNNQYMLILKCM